MGIGAIRQRRLKDGQVVYFLDYRDPAGHRVRQIVGPRKKAAEKALALRQSEVVAGTHRLPLAKTAPFDAFARKWLEERASRVKPSTRESYEDVIEGHLVPHFGSAKLSAVNEDAIEAYLKAKLDEKGKEEKPRLSVTSINYYLAILRMILGHARKRRLIPDNPATNVQKVANRSEEVEEAEFHTAEEIRSLLDAFDSTRRPVYLTGIMTGLRRGELLGLRWDDIDFASDKIHVRRQLVRVKTGRGYELQLQTPKSQRNTSKRSGYRSVDMPPIVKQTLLSLPSRFRGGLVFCTDGGTPIDPDNLVKRDYARAVRRAKLRWISWHAATRHTYAALQIAQGVHPKYLQVQLGHADISTTLNTYGHLRKSVV